MLYHQVSDQKALRELEYTIHTRIIDDVRTLSGYLNDKRKQICNEKPIEVIVQMLERAHSLRQRLKRLRQVFITLNYEHLNNVVKWGRLVRPHGDGQQDFQSTKGAVSINVRFT